MKKNIQSIIFLCFLFFSINAVGQNTPCTAIPITYGPLSSNCGVFTSDFDLGNVSASGMGNPNGCPSGVFSNGVEDLWYSLTVPADVYTIVMTMTWSGCGLFCTSNPGLAFYNTVNGDCNNMMAFECDGDDALFPSQTFDYTIYNLTPGEVILFRYWETDNQNSDMIMSTHPVPANDICQTVEPLSGTGTNYCATDDFEPDDWAPEAPIFFPFDCAGGGWSSNENGVWYEFTVDASTPQPISINIDNVVCDNTGGANLQMGIWTNNNTCDLGAETIQGCSVGTGIVTVGPLNLPLGDYYVFVDGNAGANCEWRFTSEEILPITIEEFKGRLVNKTVELNWTLGSEIDVDRYEIERSNDGENFKTIGNLTAGNSENTVSYEFRDIQPVPGNNYYRIRFVELDGSTSFSETIVIKLEGPRVVGVYPNPLQDVLNLDVAGFEAGDAELSLFSAAGQLVYKSNWYYDGFANTLTVSLPNLSDGIYLYSLRLNDKGYHGKVIK